MSIFPTNKNPNDLTDDQVDFYKQVIQTSSREELIAAGCPADVVDDLIAAAETS